MTVVSSLYVKADLADLHAERDLSGVYIYLGIGHTIRLGRGTKAATLACLAHLTELVQALPDDEVTA